MEFLVFFLCIPPIGLCLGISKEFSLFSILHVYGRFLQKTSLKACIIERNGEQITTFDAINFHEIRQDGLE